MNESHFIFVLDIIVLNILYGLYETIPTECLLTAERDLFLNSFLYTFMSLLCSCIRGTCALFVYTFICCHL